jgi:hypothetical protein
MKLSATAKSNDVDYMLFVRTNEIFPFNELASQMHEIQKVTYSYAIIIPQETTRNAKN